MNGILSKEEAQQASVLRPMTLYDSHEALRRLLREVMDTKAARVSARVGTFGDWLPTALRDKCEAALKEEG